MSEAFHESLDIAIRHLKRLRERGVRYVAVSPERVAALSRPASAIPGPATARVAPANSGGRANMKAPAEPTLLAETPVPSPPPTAMPPPTRTAPRPASSPSPEGKEAAFAALRSRALACTRCPKLVASRTQVVFGVGDIHSPLMFVGEAPGADEDQQGEPFVGRAGLLLTKIIETMGLSRQSVYIGNVLKCRPDTPGQRSGNRKPTAAEMKTCLPYLLEQIELIQPKVLVALGATALEGLFGRAMPITRARGTWLEFQGIPTMPTYHPAYLLRNQSLTEKRKVWEDMLQVLERLGRPITEKQRSYFLTPKT